MKTRMLLLFGLLAGLPAIAGLAGCQSWGGGGCGCCCRGAPPETPAAANKKTCPVSGEELGSMGEPVAVTVKGRTVLVCCQGCVKKLKRDPDRYLGGATTAIPAPPDQAKSPQAGAPRP